MRFLRAVDGWWFGKGSPVTLGVFRLLMGGLALVNLTMVALDFDAWFTDRGYVPVGVVKYYLGEHARLSLLWGVSDTRITLAIFVLTMIAALLTAVGLFSRISAAALAIGIVSIHVRNPFILNGGDTMLRVSLMVLALSPCGKAVSLDRIIALRRGTVSGPPVEVSLWPQKLMQVQIAIVYLMNVWNKSDGHYWREGIAVWYPLNLNEFYRFPVPAFMKENHLMLAAATYGTMLAWLAMGTLAFSKLTRKYALAMGVGAHLFIEYSMNIPLFAFIMLATYVNFFDGAEISAWWNRWRRRIEARKYRAGREKSPTAMQRS